MSDFLTSIVWGGVPREITQPYGANRHCGIDIGLIVGEKLFAARDGMVIACGYGFLGITVDGAAQEDWYCHIDSAVVAIGQHVARGQHVAYSGAKQVPGGPAITGPHLHFEVQVGALNVWLTSLDPVPVLVAPNPFASGGKMLCFRPAGPDRRFDLFWLKDQQIHHAWGLQLWDLWATPTKVGQEQYRKLEDMAVGVKAAALEGCG
jgi:hypothetical protein